METKKINDDSADERERIEALKRISQEAPNTFALRWKPAYPPSNAQEYADWNGMRLWVHEAGSWWVHKLHEGRAGYIMADHHTAGQMGKNKADAKRLVMNAAMAQSEENKKTT